MNILQMSQIKLYGQGSKEKDQQNKPKLNLRLAIRLAQKQQQEIMALLQKYHNPLIIKPIEYDQEKTQLQKYLDLTPQLRNKKILKGIKAQLSYLSCFQVQTQNDMPRELLVIMKRDIDMFTAVISKFIYAKIYPKGSIIQTVASNRQNIKILLKGTVSIFEPINYKSFKNCTKLKKDGQIQIQWLDQFVKFNNNKQIIRNPELQNSRYVHRQQKNISHELRQHLQDQLQKKYLPLSNDLARKILAASGIITSTTLHRHTKTINNTGQLICSQKQQFIIKQSKLLEHNAICMTEVYVAQLQQNVYKAAISLLKSDEQKLFIEILLRKFDMMQYFDAKQYIKKQYMINKKQQEIQQLKNKQKQFQQINEIFPTQKIIRNSNEIDSQSQQYKSDSGKQQIIDSDTYQIRYDSDIYLIISGEATIIIDIIEQTRHSSAELAHKIRNYKPKSILKLYTSDIFGFEEIGKIKQYNLRYRINKNSKLLLLSQNIYVKHFNQINGFKNCFKLFQAQRNMILKNILLNLQRNIQDQQIKKYRSISTILPKQDNLIKPKSKSIFNELNLIKQIQFMGRSQFEIIQNRIKNRLIQQNEDKIINNKFKQLIKTGNQLKDSLKLSSKYKNNMPKKCQIIGEFIQIRTNNGVLKRKKCIVEDNQNNQHRIFRKLGIISDQDRNNHNFALISNRKSKYQLEDFQKQKKQINRLKQITKSLPKLNYFYSKKSQILYNNIHKRDY